MEGRCTPGVETADHMAAQRAPESGGRQDKEERGVNQIPGSVYICMEAIGLKLQNASVTSSMRCHSLVSACMSG